MEMGISTYTSNSIRRYAPVSNRRTETKSTVADSFAMQKESSKKQAELAAQEAYAKLKQGGSLENSEQYLNDILQFSNLFNRDLKFSINRELQEVVVKVVDRKTDKVIKEIPPESLQKLHVRMKEMMGLLFDEEI